jgi:hypothetical protein
MLRSGLVRISPETGNPGRMRRRTHTAFPQTAAPSEHKGGEPRGQKNLSCVKWVTLT